MTHYKLFLVYPSYFVIQTLLRIDRVIVLYEMKKPIQLLSHVFNMIMYYLIVRTNIKAMMILEITIVHGFLAISRKQNESDIKHIICSCSRILVSLV